MQDAGPRTILVAVVLAVGLHGVAPIEVAAAATFRLQAREGLARKLAGARPAWSTRHP